MRRRPRHIRLRGHGTFRIEQVLVVGTEAQLDQRPRVGDLFALPSMFGLVALHGLLRRVIPGGGWFPAQVVFANQGFLDFLGTLGIDFLLPAFAGTGGPVQFTPPACSLVRGSSCRLGGLS